MKNPPPKNSQPAANVVTTGLQVGNQDPRLKVITTKTTLMPRSVCPRWSGVVDQNMGQFTGEIVLGNGTCFRVGFFFDNQRHFWVAIPGIGSWQFPSGQRTTWELVQEVLSLESETDAKNLADFINSQIDDGMDEEDHVGVYERRFCS